MNSLSVKDGTGTTQALRAVSNGTDLVVQHGRTPQSSVAGNTASGTNANAVVTKAAPGSTLTNVLAGIYWSYSAAPTGGGLKIEDVAANITLNIDIIAGGPGFYPFDPPMKNVALNTALIVTLLAGGSGVVGKVSLHAWTE